MAKNAVAKTFRLTLEPDGWYRTSPPADTSAPPVPSGLIGTATLTTISLTWNASTDVQSGVGFYTAEYREVGASTWTLAGITASPSIVIGNLTSDTDYEFRVSATDLAPTANTSAYSGTYQLATLTPTAPSSEAYPFDGGYLQGTTNFPLTDTEVANRAMNRVVVWTGPERGYNLNDFQTGINAVTTAATAAGRTVEHYLYTNTSEYQIDRPAAANNRAVWDKIDNENWWLRESWPAGLQIRLGTNDNYQCNPTLSHTEAVASYGSQKLYWTEWYPWNSLINLGMTNIAGVMCDNMQIEPFSGGGDLNEGGAGTPSGAAARALIIAGGYRKRDFVNSLGKKVIYNGAQSWWVAYSRTTSTPVDERANMQDWCDGCILELYASPGWNTRWSIIYYQNSMGTLSWNNFRTYPGNATVSAAPAAGTPLRNTFGGWQTSTTGGDLYTPRSNQSIRAMYEWLLTSGIYRDPKLVIVQTQGPKPERFGPTSGAWAHADRHARSMYLHVYAATPWRSNYTMYEASPNAKAVSSYLDEQFIRWGDPVAGELGKPGLQANHGSGVGNGYASGVHVRKFYDSVSGKHRLVVWNPLGNGNKTIRLPAGTWRKFGSADIGGTPQSTYNDGTTVSSSFLIEDHNACLLLEV